MRQTSLRTRLEEAAGRRPRATAYAFVGLASLVALFVAALAREMLPDAPVSLLFAPVLCGAALLCGLGPGLFATLLGLLAGGLLGEDIAGLAVFGAIGIGVSAVGEWLFRNRSVGDRTARILAEREAHLRSIYDTAPDALIVIDERGVMQSYSAGAERMFGWSADEVLGRNVHMLMPSPYRGQHDGYVRHYLDTGERRIIGIGRIVVGERKDGSSFPMELAVGEVRSDRGRVFTGFVRDLSERQATEARLQELQAELLHMSRLTAMGEMASALAHELNQPLSAIANYLNGARRLLERTSGAEPRALDALDKASEQALRAGEIIRRLRDFLARGETERSLEALSRLVQEACALAMVGAKERGVRVRYDFARDAEMVMVDRVPIQQVVINLVRNALDALDDQPRREIVIVTERLEDGFARVSVSDTGAGVDETTAGRLFEPFVTTKPEGMGVGLSISRTIVEAHGGRIWTEPNPGGGAIFRFTLRLAEATDGHDE